MKEVVIDIKKLIENVSNNILQFYSLKEQFKDSETDSKNILLKFYLNSLIRSLFQENEVLTFVCPLCKEKKPMYKYIGSYQLSIPLVKRMEFKGFEGYNEHLIENRFNINEGNFCTDCLASRKVICYYCKKEFNEAEIFIKGERPACDTCYSLNEREILDFQLRNAKIQKEKITRRMDRS